MEYGCGVVSSGEEDTLPTRDVHSAKFVVFVGVIMMCGYWRVDTQPSHQLALLQSHTHTHTHTMHEKKHAVRSRWS
jgi:hypothetical protein